MGHDDEAFARALWRWQQIGQFSQESQVVTSAPARRLAHGVAALAIAGPAVLLGGVAWADPTPAPADAGSEAPVTQPSVGSWIIGGTLLEGSSGTAAKPAAKPAAVTTTTTRTATTRTSTRTTSGTTTRRTTTATAPDGASALPFTGNHVDALLPAGVCFLVGGVMFMIAGRPRPVAA
jgi:hypothetical protein